MLNKTAICRGDSLLCLPACPYVCLPTCEHRLKGGVDHGSALDGTAAEPGCSVRTLMAAVTSDFISVSMTGTNDSQHHCTTLHGIGHWQVR